ncbi:hypothetical protein LCGC14_2537310, partial [marine sediment metagenome]
VTAARVAGSAVGPEVRREDGPTGADLLDGRADLQVNARVEAEREQLQAARQAMLEAAGKLQSLREDLLKDAEAQLLDLAVNIARKILMGEIEAGRYEIEPIVREALMRVPSCHDVEVHLNPDDLSECKMAQESGDAAQGERVRFVPDPGVNRADCVIRTPEGTVDATVEAKLSEALEAMKAQE